MQNYFVIRLVITIPLCYNILYAIAVSKEGCELDTKKGKVPMEHLNIGEFNRGQSSKLIRGLAEEDKTAFILKNGKPIAVVISYERYQRMFEQGIDINDY